MLPHKYRLPPYSIRDVMRRGRRIVRNGITMLFLHRTTHLPQEQILQFRVAVITSANIDTRAVIRNRMRRVMHESIAHILPNISNTTDCVVIGSKSLIGLSQSEVEIRLDDIFRYAGLTHK